MFRIKVYRAHDIGQMT